MLVVCTLGLALCGGHAAAQAQPADTLKVDYFAYAHTTGAPDGTLRLTNPGTSGGNLCAAIYVFDPEQELSECCSCLLTPNGLRTLSVNSDLTNNPLTGVVLKTGLISIVSTPTTAGQCPFPVTLTPFPALRAWATHIDQTSLRIIGQPFNMAGFAGSVAASQDATLSSTEVTELANACHAIVLGTSGGICTCGTGD
jgi:hypothetical protein